MKRNQKIRSKTIQTLKVYTKDEVVFTKGEREDWFPIPFQWVSLPASK